MIKTRFLYVGAPKSGSTWLYDALMEQPDVEVYSGKYIHYFKDYYSRGIAWYDSHFVFPATAVASGDFDTTYMFNREAVARIASEFPETKLIVSVTGSKGAEIGLRINF